MSDFNAENGKRVAEAINRRIENVAQQLFDKSARDKTVYGIVTQFNDGISTIKVKNNIYTNVPALKNVGKIKKGDRVMCLVPNGNFSDITILGVSNGEVITFEDNCQTFGVMCDRGVIKDMNIVPNSSNVGTYQFFPETQNKAEIAEYGIMVLYHSGGYSAQIMYGNYYLNGWRAERMWDPNSKVWTDWRIYD